MAVVGYLGENPRDGIQFEVSSQTVRTLSNWKWSGSARYATHQRHGGNALTEFTGLDPDKITFDIILKRELGVEPLDDISKLWKYQREGIAVALTVGGHGYGRYRWNVINFTNDIRSTDTKGKMTSVTVSVTLQEYLRK